MWEIPAGKLHMFYAFISSVHVSTYIGYLCVLVFNKNILHYTLPSCVLLWSLFLQCSKLERGERKLTGGSTLNL